MLCKPTSRPSKYIFLLCYLLLKKVIKNISFNVFWIFKLHELRNGIIQHKKHLKFLSDHFAENEKEKRLPKKLKKCKTNTILTIKIYQVFAGVPPYNLMFPISLLKKNLLWYWKWQTFDGKIWPFFMTSESRFMFLCFFCLLINK